jgi:hypothetical protein
MSQQLVHHNGMWWSRDSSGGIHYYDDREKAGRSRASCWGGSGSGYRSFVLAVAVLPSSG